MPNENGSVYGLTVLSPIINDEKATPSHDLQIRKYLATLPTGADSPFAHASGTHLARLVVMDDVIYVGMPVCEEHLKSKYLIFEANLDADSDQKLDNYLLHMAQNIPEHLDAIWKHCVGYPGAASTQAFISYIRSCQIETTFFFAAVNNKSVSQTLQALQTQRAVADFIARHQCWEPERLQAEFLQFAAQLEEAPVPPPGSMGPARDIKTGGRNE
jgi:hypothetical protein